MNTPPRPLLAPGTPVRVLTNRHRDQTGIVVTGPTDGAWDDLVVWVDLGQFYPVPVLPHEVHPVEHADDHQPHAPQADQRADGDPATDPVAAGLAALRRSWPTGRRGLASP
jgi:hypothetical protein